MKLLYLHYSSWTNEYPILKKLTALGHEVSVLAEKQKSGWLKKITPYFFEPGDDIITFWYDPKHAPEKILSWPVDRFFKRSFGGRNLAHRMLVITQALNYFKPDAVICSDGFAYAIPAAFLKKLGILKVKLLVSYIGGDILDLPNADYGRRRTTMTSWLIKTSLKHIDVMRPVSPMLEEILQRDGADPTKIHVLPSHLVTPLSELDSVYAQRAAISKRIRDQYQIPESYPVIVTLSGNHKSKGLHILAQAWPHILKKIPNCHWLLCGPVHPWLNESVFPMLEDSQSKDSVHITGTLSGAGVFEHLAAADLHINPTLGEGLNMATVEAAAICTPTITSNGAGIANWLSKFNCGRVVQTSNSAAFAAGIVDVLSDVNQLGMWRQNCRAMAKEFDLEHVALGLIALLQTAK